MNALNTTERDLIILEGRRLASLRDDLIAQGANPLDLLVPLHPDDLGDAMSEQCRYMAAAYPTAEACQQASPTDEQIAWALDDAAVVVDDFDPMPDAWTATEPALTNEAGLEFTLTINDREYVIQPSEWDASRPVSRAQWEAWQDEDCDHDWLDRPESDTRECLDCGVER